MPEHPSVVLAMIGLLGIAAQWLSWWLKLPAIVFLLLIGVLAGPVSGAIQPDVLFGELLFPLMSLGVAVILFEGSLTLKFQQIRGVEGAVRNLVTVGALLNWAVMGFAAAWLIGFSWELALLFGALVTVTGPTVIVPLLRSVRPQRRVANVLRWEGIIIDPLGALLAVLVFEAIVSGQEEHAVQVFALSVGVGGLSGALGAWLLGSALRRHWLPDYLHNVAALALVLGVFSLSNSLQEESGLLAVTVMGIILANLRQVDTDEILSFKESLSLLLISGMFIVLAARIDFAEFQALGWNAVYLLGVILFVARPLAVWVSTLGTGLNWREKALIAWIAPRGIVAAAVTPLFVLKIDPDSYAGEELLVPLVFIVIAGTVILQSFTARPLARLLKVAEPEPRGVLIVGANPVSQAIAKALKERGFEVLMADTTWSHLRSARMAGLRTYFGNAVSAHADRHLDLVGLGRLFALSRHPALNTLACLRYKTEFGSKHVYALQASKDTDPEGETNATKRSYSVRYRGRRLFGQDITYTQLAGLLRDGGTVRATELTVDFGFADYSVLYGSTAVPLFALDERGLLKIFTADEKLEPRPGWTLISLLPADQAELAKAEDSERKTAKEAARGEIARRPARKKPLP